MDVNLVMDIAREAIMVSFKLAIPILLTALIVGLLVSLVQALTQIQDQTIAFVPKLVTIFVVIFFLMPYFGQVMSTFSDSITYQIINMK